MLAWTKWYPRIITNYTWKKDILQKNKIFKFIFFSCEKSIHSDSSLTEAAWIRQIIIKSIYVLELAPFQIKFGVSSPFFCPATTQCDHTGRKICIQLHLVQFQLVTIYPWTQNALHWMCGPGQCQPNSKHQTLLACVASSLGGLVGVPCALNHQGLSAHYFIYHAVGLFKWIPQHIPHSLWTSVENNTTQKPNSCI